MATSIIQQEGILKKLSSGMMGKKWQDRQIILDESGLSQYKLKDNINTAKQCVAASDISAVKLNAVKDGVEICIQLGSGEYVLKAVSQDHAQTWADKINRISPAGVAQAKDEADAKAKKEAEEKTRKEAEAKAKLEAEQKAKAEAEAQATREAEEGAKQEAEEKAQQEADEKAAEEEKAQAAEAEMPEKSQEENGDTESNVVEDKSVSPSDETAAEPEQEPEEPSSPSPKPAKPRMQAKPAARPPPAPSSDGSVFDRLSQPKHRREAINTNRGFRGMDGHVSRSSGTGSGGNKSWLDVGMEETRTLDFSDAIATHKTIGSDAIGGCMSKLSVGRFQAVTANGHYRSMKDMEECAQRDIECVDKSTFTQFASTKSQFGTHSNMGMGGSSGNRFAFVTTSTGHYMSNKDMEESAKRDFLEIGSVHTSTFNGGKSLSTKQGMAMGGAVGRFQLTTASGHIVSAKDQEDSSKRDHSISEESEAMSSTFASAMKRGNPNFSVMGGKVGRFEPPKPVSEKGPGDYCGSTTNYDLLPMPARAMATAP